MKYIVFLIDGMADEPVPELGGKTPLEAARTPLWDEWASAARFGTFVTLPEPLSTSSDVANMSVLGWDQRQYPVGRGAIESYGAGYPMDDETVAFRMNLITVRDGLLEDYSAGHISEPEAEEIIAFLRSELETDRIRIRKGVSYRHLLYLKGREFSPDVDYDKPDSSHGMAWRDILPRPSKPGDSASEATAATLVDLVNRSEKILADHPVNRDRVSRGENPANLIWPWSGGRKPGLPSFRELYGKRGAVVSAVDVILGIGRLGGMEAVKPEGATGFTDTNYENKARAAVELLKRNDFVYLHIEAADECSHLGDLEGKIRVIEDCDRRLARVFLDEYNRCIGEPLRVMVVPDHPVPIRMRKHTRDAVPFMISGAGVTPDPAIRTYSEALCRSSAPEFQKMEGRTLMDLLFRERIP